MSIAAGNTIFIVALVLILAFGATMLWLTFRNTDRRRGSEVDEDFVNRQVREKRSRARWHEPPPPNLR